MENIEANEDFTTQRGFLKPQNPKHLDLILSKDDLKLLESYMNIVQIQPAYFRIKMILKGCLKSD